MTTQRLLKILFNVGFAFVTVIVLGTAFLYAGLRFYGVSFFEVSSGSMEPRFSKGAVVAAKTTEPYEIDVGDVIVYQKGNFKDPIVHRVTGINSSPDVHSVVKDNHGKVIKDDWTYAARTFFTKGDANPEADGDPVNETQLMGRELFVVPFPFDYLVNGVSRTALFAVGATCVLVYIVWEVLDGVREHRRNRGKADPAAVV